MIIDSKYVTDAQLADGPITFRVVDGGVGIGLERRVTVLGSEFSLGRGAVGDALVAAGLDPVSVGEALDVIAAAVRTALDLDPPDDPAALDAAVTALKSSTPTVAVQVAKAPVVEKVVVPVG